MAISSAANDFDPAVDHESGLPRSCMLVGEGNMLIASGQVLRKRGLQIDVVISDDASVLQWARSLDIPTADHGPGVVAWLERAPVDYLFSVINLRILPKEALQLPRIAAINFHDGPLPRYAGLHATSWAIFHGEKTHGITWHLMEPSIDTGAVVRQRIFDVAADETALSLNLKSFKAGLAALEEMVPDLLTGTIAASPQDTSQRTYFAGWRRPVAAGVLDWSRRAEESEAQVRGTDFGPYFNPLVLPKIWTGGECVVAREVRMGRNAAGTPPGTVVSMDEASLTIATASMVLHVGGLATVDGEPLSIPEAATRHGFHVGGLLPVPPHEELVRLTESSETLARHERYWAGRLKSLAPVSVGPPPRRDRSDDAAGDAKDSRTWRVPGEVADWLAGPGEGWHLEEFLLAAFGVFLSRVGTQDRFDVEFRDGEQPATAPSFLCAAYVPFRFDIDEDFFVVLERVRAERMRVAGHLTYPRDLVPRSPTLRSGAVPLTESKLPVAVEIGGVGAVCVSGQDLVVRLPVTGSEGLAVFRAAHSETLWALVDRFPAFLGSLVRAGSASTREIPLTSDEERRTLLEDWSGVGGTPPSTECLHHQFEVRAAETPHAVAVRSGAVELTYGQLDARANRMAGRLRRLGVGRDVPVGVFLERSPEAIIGLLGILKAGGAYVPLDPAYPPHRLAFIVDDSGMQTVVSMRALAERLPAGLMARVFLDDDGPDDEPSDAVGPATVGDRDLAYVIYTSGSTGKPKGVMVEHGAVVNFVRAARKRYSLCAEDRILQFASLNFDASVEEIFPCLSCGGTLVLRTEEMLASARVFMEQCAVWGISVFDLPTAYWHVLVMQMKESGLRPYSDLRLVIIGGETALPSYVAAWRDLAGPRVALINTYGPTEATVVSTWADLNAEVVEDQVPIGVPISGATAYVLDRWGQPVPPGFVGELHIGGAGLARGYLNRPELTAERFVPDPFGGAPGGRLYRTGDLCRWRDHGTLAFQGRIDDQVKIRGHRIELGEIESALSAVPGVRLAAVVVHEPKPGDPRLIAYLEEDGEEVTDGFLRQSLAGTLPAFMMPAAFVRLKTMPLTPSGKIDRRALPAPDPQRTSSDPGTAPRTPLEVRLAEVWGTLLGITSVGIHDDFFDSGGDSLVAMDLVAAVRKTWDVELPLRVLFERRTIAELAAFIAGPTAGDQSRARAGTSLVPLKPTGSRRPVFMTHGIGGDVFHFLRLASLLDPEQPVWGLRALDLDEPRSGHETIEAMARDYAREVCTLQPEGPYRLGGYSVGGWIAYAVAAELCGQGHQVTLIILDSFPTCGLPWPASGVKILLKTLSEISGLRLQVRKLAAMRARGWPRYIASRIRFRVEGVLPESWRHARHVISPDDHAAVVNDRFTRAVNRYVAPRLDCSVELILGRAPLVATAFAHCQIWLWRCLVRGPVRVHRLECEHLEMFEPQSQPGLAMAVNDILAKNDPPAAAP